MTSGDTLVFDFSDTDGNPSRQKRQELFRVVIGGHIVGTFRDTDRCMLGSVAEALRAEATNVKISN